MSTEKKVNISRRQFLRYSSLTAGAAFLSACAIATPPAPAETGGAQATAPAAGEAAPAAEGIVLEAWYGHTGIDEEAIKEIFQRYEEQSDGVSINPVYTPASEGSQANEKLLTAIAGGTPPQLNLFDRFIVPQFAHEGFLTNIQEQADAAGITADLYFPFAWEEATYQGDLYCLPFDTDTRALWYNKDMFEEAGLDPESPPTNLTELMEATAALTVRGAGDRITRYGFNPVYDQAWAYTWGFAFEGLFQDPDTKRITCANPRNVEAMEFVKQFVDVIGVDDIDAMIAACANQACNGPADYFWTGQTAMTCSGNWRVAQSHRYKPDTNYGVAPFPGPNGPAPYASWAGGWSWVVPAGVEDVESAFDALNFTCGPVGQDIYNKTTFHIPTNVEAASDPFYREDPLHVLFMDLLPVSHTRPPIPAGSLLWEELFSAFRDEIPHGKKTAEQALMDVDEVVNAELEEMGFFS